MLAARQLGGSAAVDAEQLGAHAPQQRLGRSAVLLAVRDEPCAEATATIARIQLAGSGGAAFAGRPTMAGSPPVTPGCSPMMEQGMAGMATAAAGAPGGAAAEEREADSTTMRRPSHMQRRQSCEWQVVDEGDRIACLLVTRPAPRRTSDSVHPGKAEFGLEVQAAWHSQLESLIEMGYGVRASAEALRICDGDLMRSFKILSQPSAAH